MVSVADLKGVRWVQLNPLFCLKFTLKAREMVSLTFQILKFSGGTCPSTPLACHTFGTHKFKPPFTKSWIPTYADTSQIEAYFLFFPTVGGFTNWIGIRMIFSGRRGPFCRYSLPRLINCKFPLQPDLKYIMHTAPVPYLILCAPCVHMKPSMLFKLLPSQSSLFFRV